MLTVRICAGTHCTFKGSLEILEYLENDESLQNKIDLVTDNCIQQMCKEDNAPVVVVDDEIIVKATLDKILSKIRGKLGE